MKIVFNPRHLVENEYCSIIVNSLHKNGYEIFSLNEFLANPFRLRQVKVFHLNWFENLNGNNSFSVFIDLLKRTSVILLLKAFGKKIVWTMHNKIPHDKRHFYFKKAIIKFLIKFSDRIIIHSRITEDIISIYNKRAGDKIIYIPHPNYIDAYGPINPGGSHMNTLNLLFLGAVKPYKNLELLIGVVKDCGLEVKLKIAGNARDLKYKAYIEELVKECDNIEADLKYIDNSDLPAYLGSCDLLVLPYDMNSSLNSGSVILAFSYQKSVICPAIGTILELDNRDCVFAYDYSCEEEHVKALKAQIIKSLNIKKKDKDMLKKAGEKCYQEIGVANDINNVTRSLVDVYNSILLITRNN